MAAPARKNLVVFDFDWSMADQDTDRFIFEVLAPEIRREMKNSQSEMEWTDIVAMALRKAHAKGITREQIEGALRVLPIHPAMIRGVTELKAKGDTTFLCISNANNVFISTILEARGLTGLFDDVITNPAHWEENGLLSLSRRIPADAPQHHCPVGCSPNMCKGNELDKWLTGRGQTLDSYKRILFVGDGSNDFCPMIRMRSQDWGLCRTFGSLKKRVENDSERLGRRCRVRWWTGAWEAEEIFKEL